MADQTLNTRVPQQGEGIEQLLAKVIHAPYARGTYIAQTGSVTTTTTGLSIDTRCLRQLWFGVNVTSIAGGTLAVALQWQDPVSLNWFTVWQTSSGISAAGSYVFLAGESGVGSNATISPGAVFSCRLPAAVRLALIPSGATYDASVGLERT